MSKSHDIIIGQNLFVPLADGRSTSLVVEASDELKIGDIINLHEVTTNEHGADVRTGFQLTLAAKYIQAMPLPAMFNPLCVVSTVTIGYVLPGRLNDVEPAKA